jgi:hypothetical protein
MIEVNKLWSPTKTVIPAPISIGINSSRNPEKKWIPDQARHDKIGGFITLTLTLTLTLALTLSFSP